MIRCAGAIMLGGAAAPTVALTSPTTSTLDTCQTPLTASGTFSDATTVVLQGSSDGSTWTDIATATLGSGTWSASTGTLASGTRYLRAVADGTAYSSTVTLTITDGLASLVATGPSVLCVAGLTGTSHMTVASGLISQWSDSSGNGYHATQATDSNKPSASTSGGDTYAGFEYTSDTDGQALVYSSHPWSNGSTTALTVTMVLRFTAVGADYQIAYSHYSLAFAIAYSAAGKIRVYGGNSSKYGECTLASATDAIVTVVFDGAGAANADRFKLYVNGVLQTLTFAGTLVSVILTGGADALGRNSASAVQPMAGRIYAFSAWTSVLSDSTRTAVHTALGQLLECA